MKKICILGLIALSLLVTGFVTHAAQKDQAPDVRVMTFNIRNGQANDGENRWDLRKALVCDVIRDNSPDLLGLQEALRFQLDVFKQRLPEYGELGIGRDGGTEGEYSAILFRKDRFAVNESGTFWLSETPNKPSRHWGNAYRRICTWAHFSDKKSSQAFYVYNTHLDHESQEAREKGIQLIIEHLKERTPQDPFVLIGDFNVGEDNPVIKYLNGFTAPANANPLVLVDSFRLIHPEEKVVGTFNGFLGKSDGPKIDYIFVVPGTHVSKATILRTFRNERYPSDHFPVTAQLSFAHKARPIGN